VSEERFLTQGRLLSSVRRDGWVASAIDTGNSFKYRTGFGWTQYVAVDGVPGQPLVVAEDRTVTLDNPNRLVPAGGTPGNLLGVNQDADTAFVARDATGGVTVPVDFSSGVLTTICNQTIPGGAIGPNGWVKITSNLRVITNANRTVTLELPGFSLTVNTNTSALTYSIVCEYYFANQNDETGATQAAFGRVSNHRFDPATNTSSEIEVVQQSVAFGFGDTRVDWVPNVQVFASAAITGTAAADSVILEYGYVA
jgi:hypothetical protein